MLATIPNNLRELHHYLITRFFVSGIAFSVLVGVLVYFLEIGELKRWPLNKRWQAPDISIALKCENWLQRVINGHSCFLHLRHRKDK